MKIDLYDRRGTFSERSTDWEERERERMRERERERESKDVGTEIEI